MVTDVIAFGKALGALSSTVWTHITNGGTAMRTPTAEPRDKHVPDIARCTEFHGNEVLISSAKANRVFGSQPQHRWTDKKDGKVVRS